ncbi:hypothetical protein CAG63_17100, partial [Vibrio sp. V37_P2S8PM304]
SRLSLTYIVNSRGYEIIMFSICILYTLTTIPRFELNELFKNLIIIGSLPALFTKLLKREDNNTIFWVFLLSFAVQIASWMNSLRVIPDLATSYPQIKFLAALFLFVFIAFWVNGHKNRVRLLYASLVLSFIFTACYHNFMHNSFALGLSGQRVDFAMDNAQFTSMLSVVVAALTTYIITQLPKSRYKPVAYFIGGSVILFALFASIISQSRQVWLAVVVVALLSPLVCYRSFNYKRTLAIYALLAVLGSSLFHISFIHQRVTAESGVIEKVAEGDWDNIPMTSVGIRVNSWVEASKWIVKSPLLGTDKGSVKQVIQTSKKFQARPWTLGFGHLHNFYLETLVAYGLFGLLFVVLFYRTIIVNIIQHQPYPQQVFLFLFLIFWAIINSFESYNTKMLGLYAQNIVLAGLFTYPLPKLKNNVKPRE